MSKNYTTTYYDEVEEASRSPAYRETTDAKPKKATVINSRYVNLRKAPDKTSTPLTILEKGDEVEILGYPSDLESGFYKVKHNGLVGYIVSSFLKEG